MGPLKVSDVDRDAGVVTFDKGVTITMEPIRVGDVVRLNSGGPDMTVTSLRQIADPATADAEVRTMAVCEWLGAEELIRTGRTIGGDSHLHTAREFDVRCLMKV